MRVLAASIVVIVGGVAVWATWPRQSPATEAQKPKVAAPPTPAPAAPSSAPVVPKGGETPPAKADSPLVTFPDGSTAPALNGVKESIKILWNNRPYSPIKSTIHDRGLDWYLHEDGSHSTVMYQTVNGELQAVGVVASPTDVLPVREGPEPQAPPGGSPKK